MLFEEYEALASDTAVYPERGGVGGLIYASLGLAGEQGEVAEKVKKLLRDGTGLTQEGSYTEEFVKALTKELGDVLWYVAAVAHEIGVDLNEVATTNARKLRDRKDRNVLSGSGDNR